MMLNNKILLLALLILMPLNIIAGGPECEEYWNPRIKKAEKKVKEYQREYRSALVSRPDHPARQGALEASKALIEEYQEKLEKLKEAKEFCFKYNLALSKDAFNI